MINLLLLALAGMNIGSRITVVLSGLYGTKLTIVAQLIKAGGSEQGGATGWSNRPGCFRMELRVMIFSNGNAVLKHPLRLTRAGVVNDTAMRRLRALTTDRGYEQDASRDPMSGRKKGISEWCATGEAEALLAAKQRNKA